MEIREIEKICESEPSGEIRGLSADECAVPAGGLVEKYAPKLTD
jgi:hypothetical protein